MRNIYKITAVIAALAFTTGCKKYLDINSNPAVPQVVKAEILLPPIEFQMCNGTAQDYERAVSKLTQNMSGVNTEDASLQWEKQGYIGGSDVSGVMWRMTYFDLGINLENLIKDAIANQKYEYAGIGYAIKAWAYQITTDAYGPIVLDEAFTPGQLTFHYNDQPYVYDKVREWGNLSIKYLNMTSPVSSASTLAAVGTGDGIYKGDKTKWKKFVYGLFALQYGHLVNKPAYVTSYADSVIKYVGLSLANETEDASIYFTASNFADANPMGVLNAPKLNSGWLSATGTQTTYYGRQTSTILNLLTGGVRGTAVANSITSVDPRLSRFLTAGTTASTTAVTYIGTTPTAGSASPTVPVILGPLPSGGTYNGKYIFTDKARYPIMTYSQLQFALAEALFIKNGKVGNTAAVTAYRNGISATFDFYNQYGRTQATPDPAISATEIAAYMASSEVVQLATPTLLTMADIMQQKYIAQWGWGGIETWCDLRKYHYDPTIFRTFVQPPTLALSSTNGGKMSYRLRPRYNSEYVWNSEELAKFGGLLSNYNTQEMWFSLSTP